MCVRACACVRGRDREREHLLRAHMCLGGEERAGHPAGSTDGAEACHCSSDDGHILTWDPQVSGSHTSCSGLNQNPHPHPLQSHTHTHTLSQGQGPGHCLLCFSGKGPLNTTHGQVGVHTLPRVFPCECVCVCLGDVSEVDELSSGPRYISWLHHPISPPFILASNFFPLSRIAPSGSPST